MSEDVKKYIADMTAFPGSFHGAGNLKPYDPNAAVEPASDEVVDRASILPLGRTAAGKVVPAVPNLLATHPTFRGANGDDSGLLTGPARGSPNSMSDRAHNTTAGFSIPAALKAAYDSAAAMAGDQLAYWRGDYGKDNEKTAIGEDGRLYWKGTDRLAQRTDPSGIDPFIAVAGATGLNSVTGGLMASGSKAMTPMVAAAGKAGEPIRAYHGTNSPSVKFHAYSDHEIGPHFGSVDQANARLSFRDNGTGEVVHGASMVPVDIHAKNMLEIADPGAFDPLNLPYALERTGKFAPHEIDNLKAYENAMFEAEDAGRSTHGILAEFRDEVDHVLEQNGFDGLKYRNTAEHPEINAVMEKLRGPPPEPNTPAYAEWQKAWDEKAAIEDRLKKEGPFSYVPTRGTVRSATTGETLFSGGKDAGPLGTALANAARQHHEAPGVQQAIKRAADVPIDERMLVSHNLTGDNLSFTDRYFGGQLPVPSLAINKIGQPIDGFGEIGLVGAPGLAKPSGKNPVYGADAYSPRFPDLKMKMFRGDEKGLQNDLLAHENIGQWSGFMRDVERLRFDSAAESPFMLQRYLREKGETPFTREQQYEVRDRLMKDPAYRKWAQGYLTDATAQSDVKIARYNEDTGNTRYSPFNLENAVKAMKQRAGGAGNEGFDYGMPTVRARLTPPFSNFKDIQENRGRIQHPDVWRPQSDAIAGRISDMADGINPEAMKYPPTGDRRNDYGNNSRRYEAMMRAVGQGKRELMDDYDLARLPPDFDQWMQQTRGDIRNLGTDYFEAKPQRAVALGEFSGAIVPNDVPSTTMDLLKKYGINRIEPYDKGDRTAALRKFSDIAFSNPKEAGPVGAAVANAASHLPMDEASKMARAREMGALETPFYHGTTHEIDPSKGFADPQRHRGYEGESHHGAAAYLSSSQSDARDNYAGIGPDLTNRLSRFAEQEAESVGDADRGTQASWLQSYRKAKRDGLLPDYASNYGYGEREAAKAWGAAVETHVGGRPEGDVHKLMPMPQNPVRLAPFEGKRETRFDIERAHVDEDPKTGEYVVRDHKGEELDRFDNEGDAYDVADGIEPKGPVVDMVDHLRGYSPELADEVMMRAYDDDGLSAKDFEAIVRKSDHAYDIYDDDGQPVSVGQLIQDAYRAVGYDAVIMPNAEKQFTNMGIPRDTAHIAMFDHKKVRKPEAAFDPAKKDSGNWLAANPPMSAAAAVLANMASRRKSDHDDKADSKSKKATGGTVTMDKSDRRKIISRALDVVRRAAGGSVPGFADGGDTAKAVLSESTRSPVPDWLLDQQRSVRDGMPMPEGVERRFPSAPFEPFADVAGVGAELTGVPSMVRGYGNLTDAEGDGWTKAKGVGEMAMGAMPLAGATVRGAQAMAPFFATGTRGAATMTGLAVPGMAEMVAHTGSAHAAELSPAQVRELQTEMKLKGYYSGPIDGDLGPGTKRAIETYRKDQEKHAAQKAEEARQAQQMEQSRATSATALAQAKDAEARAAETKRKADAEALAERRRTEGEAKLQSVENDVPWYRDMFRKYAPVVGYGAGAVLGGYTGHKIGKLFDDVATTGATRANRLLEGEFDKLPSSDKAARINQFWAEGQPRPLYGSRDVPYTSDAGKITSNPKAPTATELYLPSRQSQVVGHMVPMGAYGAEAYMGQEVLGRQAQQELEGARTALAADPSDINIARYQAAKDNDALSKFVANMGRAGAVAHGAHAMLPRATRDRPDISKAEAARFDFDASLGKGAASGTGGRGPRPTPPGPSGQAPSGPSPTSPGTSPSPSTALPLPSGAASGAPTSAGPVSASNRPSWASDPPAGVRLKKGSYWDSNLNRPRQVESGQFGTMPKYSVKSAAGKKSPTKADDVVEDYAPGIPNKPPREQSDTDFGMRNRGGIVQAIDMARGYFTGGSVRRFADGGVPGLDAPEDPHIPHGPVVGPDGGRDDTRPVSVPSGSFIIPADVVAGLGGGNTQAGFAELDRMFGTAETTHMATGGEVPAVPIRISDGEYVISPAKVAEIGGGDLNVGHKALDKLMIQLRQQNIKQLQSLPPPAKG